MKPSSRSLGALAAVCVLAMSASTASAIHYTYDNNNQLISVSTDGNQQAVYAYDEIGNITAIALRGVVRKSNFYGLVASIPADPTRSGSVTINLTDKRSFTANFVIDGKRYALKGEFSSTGTYTGMLQRGGTLPVWDVFLTLDYLNGANAISGRFEEGGLVVAQIDADSGAFNAKTAPAADAGNYTVSISPDPAQPLPALFPQGYSIGTVSISAKGAVKFAGMLADGTKVAQGTYLSPDRTWPLYLAPYKTGGMLTGTVTFRNTADLSDLDGSLAWEREAGGKAPYAGGFAGTVGLIGSRYDKPLKGEAVLHVANATPNLEATFDSGDLADPQTKAFTLLNTNKVVSTTPKEFALSISTSSGLFKGSFVPLGETQARPFQGVILQKINIGTGWFPGGDVTGLVEIAEP